MKKQNPFYYFLYSIVFISFTVLVSTFFLQCNKTITKSEIQNLSFSETDLILNQDETKFIAILADPKPAAGEHAYLTSTAPAEQYIIDFSMTQNGEYISIKGKNEGKVELNLMAGKKIATLHIEVKTNTPTITQAALLSTTMLASDEDYNASSFEGSDSSPEFVIQNIKDYPYLSILMVDQYNEGSGMAFNWLHWEQVNIDINSLVDENNQLTISSTVFNTNDDRNYPYHAMTPPYGLHRYHFLFFFHKNTKQFTHTIDQGYTNNEYVNTFHTYFDLNNQDHAITVIGKIQK